MAPDKVTSTDMGYIFEELIRKFSESYDEQAGAHFTARDIIYLMAELLIHPDREEIAKNGCTKTAYDMAMGTSQMLGCLKERLESINDNINLSCFGQEQNSETYAIAKADMLIKGGNSNGMKLGDTLSDDKFEDYEFDYIISNPPFGIDWKKEKEAIEQEYKSGYDKRFGPGLPAISDSQMLFTLNGIKKLKFGSGRMAIIQNGSSLFTGDAGSGPSEIRKYILENDLLEAIIQLPNNLFYNTGITTYIWLISKNKNPIRKGKTQLIDASNCFIKRRKSIGNKRNDLDEKCIKLIMKAYDAFEDNTFSDEDLIVKTKVFDNKYFGYSKITIERPSYDENGKIITKKNKPVADSKLRDYENIPLKENIDEYFKREVLPYVPDSWVDKTKTKIGYEIPMTRYFYEYQAPEPVEDIVNRIHNLEADIKKSLETIFEG